MMLTVGGGGEKKKKKKWCSGEAGGEYTAPGPLSAFHIYFPSCLRILHRSLPPSLPRLPFFFYIFKSFLFLPLSVSLCSVACVIKQHSQLSRAQG